MTGPGTNTYLVGIDEVAVIDPGPGVAKQHAEAIVGGVDDATASGGSLLTHTHPDHWPGATAAGEGDRRGGARRSRKREPSTCSVDRALADGDTIDGTEFRLEVLHTPGPRAEPPLLLPRRGAHAVHRRHVLNGTSSVVSPRAAATWSQYLASLDRLRKIRRVARSRPGTAT